MKSKIKKDPLVSIITPSFNDAEFILDNIKSVKNQNWKNIEHIIFDGKSTDKTLSILKRSKDIIWFSEKDSGQSNAINKALKLVKGEYIGWLNSDDSYNHHAIKRSINFLENNKDIDLIYTDVNIINKNNKVFGVSKGREFSLENLLVNNPIKQPGVFFRRNILDEIEGLNENLHYVMDRYFWLKIFYKNKSIKYIPYWINANFRLIEGTKSYDSIDKFKDEWISVLENSEECKFYKKTKGNLINRAINKTKSSKYMYLMNKNLTKKNLFFALVYFIKCIYHDIYILNNLGFYKLIYRSFVKGEYNPSQKYLK